EARISLHLAARPVAQVSGVEQQRQVVFSPWGEAVKPAGGVQHPGGEGQHALEGFVGPEGSLKGNALPPAWWPERCPWAYWVECPTGTRNASSGPRPPSQPGGSGPGAVSVHCSGD